MHHRITTPEELSRWSNITPGKERAISEPAGKYWWSITPYYTSLMDAPLTHQDSKLEEIVSQLRSIPTVEIIRIGSRFPVLLPIRITDELCGMLSRYRPVWLKAHFNHPCEITVESTTAVDRLLQHGIPVGNQTVLLKRINDSITTMRMLMIELLRIRVRPCYLYRCDNVTGVSHSMTTVNKGWKIMEGLQGHVTEFSVPQYVLTTRIGKIPIVRPYYVSTENGLLLHNHMGQEIYYR